jgi:hypothetical protein
MLCIRSACAVVGLREVTDLLWSKDWKIGVLDLIENAAHA